MTVEEKRNAIREYCGKHVCGGCKLLEFVGYDNSCESSATDEEIEKNYSYLFGNEDIKPDETASEVDHPSHYKGEKYECIEVMIEIYGVEFVRDWCLGNAFKYLWRCKKKHDNAMTDIKKAKFYLDEYIKLEEGEAKMNGE